MILCTLKACGRTPAPDRSQRHGAIPVQDPHSPRLQHQAPRADAATNSLPRASRIAQGIFKKQKCHLIEMNNVADHVHILFDLHRTEALSNVVMHVKKGTSRWLKEQSPEFADFDWQEGYATFSAGRSQRDELIAYIRKQQQRHARISFQDEFRKFLKIYEIDFDERYVWE
jgi:putative transposase